MAQTLECFRYVDAVQTNSADLFFAPRVDIMKTGQLSSLAHLWTVVNHVLKPRRIAVAVIVVVQLAAPRRRRPQDFLAGGSCFCRRRVVEHQSLGVRQPRDDIALDSDAGVATKIRCTRS